MTIDHGGNALRESRLSSAAREIGGDGSRPSVAAAVYAVATFSLVVAIAHLWMAPGHFELWWGYGVFYLGVATAQGLYAIAVLRWPGSTLFLAGVLGYLAVVMLYVQIHTSGVPIGPHAGRAEETGVLDVSTTAFELSIIVLLISQLRGRMRGVAINAVLIAGAAIWVLRLTGILT